MELSGQLCDGLSSEGTLDATASFRVAPPATSLAAIAEKEYIFRAMTLREILDAIHALPRPDRLRLVERLNQEAWSDQAGSKEIEPPLDSMLELRDGFYVYTGPLTDVALDHRVDREERTDSLIARLNAPRG
jgi:hypothetical protein